MNKYFALLSQFVGTPDAGEVDGNKIVGLGRVMYVSDIEADGFEDACEQVAEHLNMLYLTIPKDSSAHIKNDLSVVYDPEITTASDIIGVYRSNEWGGETFWTISLSPMPEPVPADDEPEGLNRDEAQDEQKQEAEGQEEGEG